MHRKPSRMGAAVVTRKAKSGVTTFSIKYVDAAGEQAWERIGTDDEGWTRAKARAVLEERLTDVRREGLRRPSHVTVADVAREWVAVYPTAKTLKRSTTSSYTEHRRELHRPDPRSPAGSSAAYRALDRYVAHRLAAGAAPASVNRHLNVLSLIVRSAPQAPAP